MYTHWTYYILTLQEVIKMDVDHIENLEKNLVVLYSYLCSENVPTYCTIKGLSKLTRH